MNELTIQDTSCARRRLLGELVPGKTFVEVGGLWGTVNETVTVAIQAGARAATMIDMHPRESEWWTKFDARCAELGVADYQCVVGNVCDDALAARVGSIRHHPLRRGALPHPEPGERNP